MLKLRTILLSNKPYYVLLIIAIIISSIKILIKPQSKYNENITEITGTIININQDNKKLDLIVKTQEKVKVIYYLKENEKFTYNLGDKIKISGSLTKPQKNTADYLFNYQEYLEHNNIFYIMKATNFKCLEKNKNIYFYLKQKLINNLNNNPYLLTFVIGDKSQISQPVISSYQQNGISHLFSISGMHITVLSSLILILLKKLKIRETKRYFITILILLLYLSFTGLSPSILRSVLFFILFSINKVYYFYIKPTNIYLITLSISLLINENYIYDIGFWYSYSISLSLILLSSYLKSRNYVIGILKTSIIAFLASLPISLYNFYEINLLSIIYNLFFVPLISFIIFPLSLITFLFPIILPIFDIAIQFLENISLFLSKINFITFSFPRLNFFLYLIYVVIIVVCFKGIISHKKKLIYPLIILLLLHYLYPFLNQTTYVKILDVGQGDSVLLHSDNKTVLIDTGGIISYHNESSSYSITESIIIPLLKVLGIRKINYLILTHGDYDHMGEAINLVNNFKVEKVIFNCGEFNDLEQDLIKVLDKKKIEYYSCIKEINIDNNKLYFLNNKDYSNENDNSSVIYTELNNYKFLFMGDAGVEVEQDLIEKYNLKDIDILKVGHHGSRTSSSEKFINEINPKYGVISVGKNNRHGHPNKEVLNTLGDSKIYRTDQDGSIMFKVKSNKLKIETCPP